MKILILAMAMATMVGLGLLTPAIASADEGEAGFRQGPVVTLRPLNDTIDEDQDGLVELFFSNPTVNDVTLSVDLLVQVPSGMHVYGEGFARATAAGVVQGFFQAPPGTSRTIFLNIKSEKTGDFFIHFSGTYWPGDNKDAYQPLSLTAPIKVAERSVDPENPQVVDGGDVATQTQQDQAPPQDVGDDPVWKTLLPLWYVLGSMLGIAVIVYVGKTVITMVNE